MSLGHQLKECAPPYDVAEFRAIWDTVTAVGAARVSTRFPQWKADLGDQIAQLTQIGLATPSVDYARAIDRLQAFRAETSSRWGDVDALLLPTVKRPPN